MKRITHFKGYGSCVDFDEESKTFVTKAFFDHEQHQGIIEADIFACPDQPGTNANIGKTELKLEDGKQFTRRTSHTHDANHKPLGKERSQVPVAI